MTTDGRPADLPADWDEQVARDKAAKERKRENNLMAANALTALIPTVLKLPQFKGAQVREIYANEQLNHAVIRLNLPDNRGAEFEIRVGERSELYWE
jgi:hypothetical protein